jgi:hypothetical protein
VSEYESSEFTSPESPRPEREGLPRSYRMRADAHYVEALSAPARDTRDSRDTREGRARDASRSTHANDSANALPALDRRILDQIGEDVAAIESAAAMLASDPSPLSRRVGLELIRAQSARASWLVRAHALVAGGAAESDLVARRRPVQQILRDVRDRALAECRLAGVGLEIDPVEPADLSATTDPALATGLTGAIVAQLGLLSGVEGGVIRLGAVPGVGDPTAFEVWQDVAGLPSSVQGRFFDMNWAGRPGGWLAGLGATAFKAAADRLGGRASIGARDGRGCVLRWTLSETAEIPQ